MIANEKEVVMNDRRQPQDRRVADRRSTHRVALERNVRILSATSPSTIYQGWLLDVSEAGISVILEQPIQEGERLLIEVCEAERILCSVIVQCVWTDSFSAKKVRAGCESLARISSRQMTQLKLASRSTPSTLLADHGEFTVAQKA